MNVVESLTVISKMYRSSVYIKSSQSIDLIGFSTVGETPCDNSTKF